MAWAVGETQASLSSLASPASPYPPPLPFFPYPTPPSIHRHARAIAKAKKQLAQAPEQTDIKSVLGFDPEGKGMGGAKAMIEFFWSLADDFIGSVSSLVEASNISRNKAIQITFRSFF